jgi:hypothetical protein
MQNGLSFVSGGVLDSSLSVYDCQFDLSAKASSRPSGDLIQIQRFLNATFSAAAGEPTNNFLISYSRLKHFFLPVRPKLPVIRCRRQGDQMSLCKKSPKM